MTYDVVKIGSWEWVMWAHMLRVLSSTGASRM